MHSLTGYAVSGTEGEYGLVGLVRVVQYSGGVWSYAMGLCGTDGRYGLMGSGRMGPLWAVRY
eukprot:3933896-Rhodomonas_salina.2